MKRRDFVKGASLIAVPLIAGSMTACESVNAPNVESNNWSEDFKVMVDAAKFEAIAIRTYQTAIDSGKFDQAPIGLKENAILFMAHHTEHLALFNKNFAEHDGFPQIIISDFQPDARLTDAQTFLDIIKLNLQMEFDASRFYFSKIGNQLITKFIRKFFADILPIEVGHVIAYKFSLGQKPAINGAFFRGLSTGL